jgi:hypothetical protein
LQNYSLFPVLSELRDDAALAALANTLREQRELDESECYIDTMVASVEGGGEQNGPTQRGKKT